MIEWSEDEILLNEYMRCNKELGQYRIMSVETYEEIMIQTTQKS